MEVHHHAHPSTSPGHRKKWTHYFWEFLMLFLAVFCGFLAEYQLEHKIEKDRAKELARSFYDELKSDSVNAVAKIQNRVKQEKAFSYLMDYFKDSSLTHLSKEFQLNFLYGILFRSPAIFEPRTVVFDQLKNSGSLRYFKNDDFQKLIGDLSVSVQNVADRHALESSVRVNYLNPLIIQHFDYEFEKKLRNDQETDIFSATVKYEQTNELIPFQLRSVAKLDREYASNLMGFYGRNGMESTRTVHLKRYTEVNAALLKLLREDFHLK